VTNTLASTLSHNPIGKRIPQSTKHNSKQPHINLLAAAEDNELLERESNMTLESS
jgi:hypothetical protein